MNSLRLNGTLTITGIATGNATQPDNNTPVSVRLIETLTSAGSGASLANDLLYYSSRSLAAGANETFDLTNFVSVLTETGASMSKVRIYAVVHESTSLATTGIRVGNAAVPYPGQLDTATTTRTLAVGTGFAELIPTTAGIAVTAGMGVKVTNLDGSNAATYSIVVSGE